MACRKFDDLYDAVREGTPSDVRGLLEGGSDPNGPGNIFTGGTLVHAAAERGNGDILKLLLQFGADPNRPDLETGTTPLQYAIVAGKTEVIRILVDAGCTA